jgi:RNA polymerase sigma-70 factor (ECF subfamily)
MAINPEKILFDAYEAHSEAIYRHCYFRLFSKERAEEAVQETFMKTWQYLADGKKIENIRAFLYRVASNAIVDEIRRKKEDSLEDLMEKSENLPGTSEDSAEHKMLLSQVREAIHKLPEDFREIIVMRYIDDLGPSEIAEALGIKPNAASVRINRAIKELKKYLT